MEGMLFWLEADARIRRLSGGEKSLDDFCHRFFKASRKNRLPKPYTREQVVRDLRAVAKFDWDGLIARRVESAQQAFDPDVAGLLGYRYELLPESPNIPGSTFRQGGGVDLLDSLGVTFRNDGVVSAVLLGSAADRARLATGMKVIAVGDQQWSRERMLEAVRRASDRRRIDLLVQDGETISHVQLQDYDGLQYWNLTRDESEPDLLREILRAPE